MRFLADSFFRKKYGHRAVMLETVAAVPGMVGGMLQHLKSLRRFQDDRGWIKTLLDEAENERMHLMTFLEISKPTVFDRFLVILAQGIFFNGFFLFYVLSPRTAHRFVGYLEEEAVYSYTQYLEEIDAGRIENIPAPKIAIDYWGLWPDATLRDVILVVREDEAGHRDVNHGFSDQLG
jgi:ubiquinol oxidase